MLDRSTDVPTWEFRYPFCVEGPWMAGPSRSTLGWECPDVFTFGDQIVMIACVWDGEPISVSWFSGE